MSVMTPPHVMLAVAKKEEQMERLASSPADVRSGLLGQHEALLLSLDEQRERLREFNERFWDGALSAQELAAVDTSGDHPQSVDDLELLYVEFGSPATNVNRWWSVIVSSQPRSSRWLGAVIDDDHLRLAEPVAQYSAGIHRVRLNLVANWRPASGRTVEQVRAAAVQQNRLVAHAEVLAAYGLHPQLLERLDGDTLPFVDLAGFELRLPGDSSWNLCPSVYWPRGGQRVDMDVYFVDGIGYDWAAPTLVDSAGPIVRDTSAR
jgi:hypothetical protein